jgi:hypothetical protein
VAYIHTFLRLRGLLCGGDAGLFKGPPFEVLLVAPARHRAPRTLLAGRLRLVALEALVLARDAAWLALALVLHPLRLRCSQAMLHARPRSVGQHTVAALGLLPLGHAGRVHGLCSGSTLARGEALLAQRGGAEERTPLRREQSVRGRGRGDGDRLRHRPRWRGARQGSASTERQGSS